MANMNMKKAKELNDQTDKLHEQLCEISDCLGSTAADAIGLVEITSKISKANKLFNNLVKNIQVTYDEAKEVTGGSQALLDHGDTNKIDINRAEKRTAEEGENTKQ